MMGQIFERALWFRVANLWMYSSVLCLHSQMCMCVRSRACVCAVLPFCSILSDGRLGRICVLFGMFCVEGGVQNHWGKQHSFQYSSAGCLTTDCPSWHCTAPTVTAIIVCVCACARMLSLLTCMEFVCVHECVCLAACMLRTCAYSMCLYAHLPSTLMYVYIVLGCVQAWMWLEQTFGHQCVDRTWLHSGKQVSFCPFPFHQREFVVIARKQQMTAMYSWHKQLWDYVCIGIIYTLYMYLCHASCGWTNLWCVVLCVALCPEGAALAMGLTTQRAVTAASVSCLGPGRIEYCCTFRDFYWCFPSCHGSEARCF